MGTYKIAVLSGDGVGPEVMREALKVLTAVQRVIPNLRFNCTEYPVGALCYRRTGSDLPQETFEACKQSDAILFGSAGLPDIRFPDGTEILRSLPSASRWTFTQVFDRSGSIQAFPPYWQGIRPLTTLSFERTRRGSMPPEAAVSGLARR